MYAFVMTQDDSFISADPLPLDEGRRLIINSSADGSKGEGRRTLWRALGTHPTRDRDLFDRAVCDRRRREDHHFVLSHGALGTECSNLTLLNRRSDWNGL
jgi:hypothetical protein